MTRIYTEKQKEARRIRERAQYQNNKNKQYHAARTKRYRIKLKAGVITAYGGKCSCCGELDAHFLTVEHKNGDGKKHRADFLNSIGVYRDLRNRKYPPGYTILCFNCNIASSLFGRCPHQVEPVP